MRRFIAAVFASSLVLVAAAGPAAADVQKLVIKDPGYVMHNGFCTAGAEACTESPAPGASALIDLVIKCSAGEIYTLFVTVKQGDDNQGTAQTGGECSGDSERRFVNVYDEVGYGFEPGRAKVKASAFSDPGGATTAAEGVFDVNTEKRITLVEGPPEI